MHQGTEKVVVTGGAGFIGSHLVDHLLASRCSEIVVFDNFSSGRLANLARHRGEPRLRVIDGDIGNYEAVSTALRGTDLVFHLAADSSVVHAVPGVDQAITANIVGTLNVLRAASRDAVRHVIFASSWEVYGEPIALPVHEDSHLVPINVLGACKLAGETFCRMFRQEFGLQTTILRLATVYGPRDSGYPIPIWIERAGSGQELDVNGGQRVLDMIGVGQAVAAMIQAATVDSTLPPINIASGTGTRGIEVARRIARLNGGRSRIRLLPARSTDVKRFVADIHRMRRLLRIEPALDPLDHLSGLVTGPGGAGDANRVQPDVAYCRGRLVDGARGR